MINSFKKSFFLLVGREEKKSLFFKFILFLPSVFFKSIVLIKNRLYEIGWFVSKRVKRPVISVGNIIAGGSGKTPIVLALAKHLLNSNYRVGIASRGYLSKSEKKSVIGCMGKGPIYSPEIIGDEPFLLAKRCPEIFLGVGANRYSSCQKLIEIGVDIILLDDGMQHRKLYRDIEIVVLHGQKLLGKNAFLPNGLLRDNPKRLKEADLIVVNHTNDFTKIIDCVSLYTKAPIIFVGPKVSGIYSLSGAIQYSLKDVRVGAFCAIADPKSFLRLLKKEGAHVVETLIGHDHEKISSRNLQKFAKKCKRAKAELIVCTEKDQVKYLQSFKPCLPVVYVEIDIQFLQGKESWNKLMDRAVSLINNNNIDKSMQKKECV